MMPLAKRSISRCVALTWVFPPVIASQAMVANLTEEFAKRPFDY